MAAMAAAAAAGRAAGAPRAAGARRAAGRRRRARPSAAARGGGGGGGFSKKPARDLGAELVTSVEEGENGVPKSVTVSATDGRPEPTKEQMDATADAILNGKKVWLRSKARVKRKVAGGAYLTDFMSTSEGHLTMLGAGTTVTEVTDSSCDPSVRLYSLQAPAMKFPGLTLRPTSIMQITNDEGGARMEQIEAQIDGEPPKMVAALRLMTSDQTLSTDVKVKVGRDGDAELSSDLRLDVGMLLPKKFPAPVKLIEGLGAKLFSQALEKQANTFMDKLEVAYAKWALEQGEGDGAGGADAEAQ